jgi:xylan 1,4-beta-xylosidase
LPVTWRDGWPMILDQGKTIPWIATAPIINNNVDHTPLTGNFTWRDDFDTAALRTEWVQLRAPKTKWWNLASPGVLSIEPLTASLADKTNSSFLGRRQQHQHFDFSASLVTPVNDSITTGIAAFQSDHYWLYLGVKRSSNQLQIFLEERRGENQRILTSKMIATTSSLRLRIRGNADRYSFDYAKDDTWTTLAAEQDATLLSTQVAGGFVGTLLGPYARDEKAGAARQ